MTKATSGSGIVMKLIGGGLALAAVYMLVGEAPSLMRYLRMKRIAKSPARGTAKGLPAETSPIYAQAPRRALLAQW
jgi:hypothetical protein